MKCTTIAKQIEELFDFIDRTDFTVPSLSSTSKSDIERRRQQFEMLSINIEVIASAANDIAMLCDAEVEFADADLETLELNS